MRVIHDPDGSVIHPGKRPDVQPAATAGITKLVRAMTDRFLSAAGDPAKPMALVVPAILVATLSMAPLSLDAQGIDERRPIADVVHDCIERGVRSSAMPFDRKAPDFTAMDGRFASARIIGVGQMTHGSKEIFQAQADMVRYLVVKHGIRALLFEDAYAGVALVNDYIHGKTVDMREMTQGLMTPWRTPELGELFAWMREWNRSHPSASIDIIGIDNGINSIERSIADYVKSRPKPDRNGAAIAMRPVRALLNAAGAGYGKVTLTNIGMADALEARVATMRAVFAAEATLAKGRTEDAVNGALAAKSLDLNVEQVIASMRADASRTGRDIPFPVLDDGYASRDRYSASIALFYSGLFPDRKLAIWAHGAHLDKSSITWGSMGSQIAFALGDGFAVATVTTGKGEVTAMTPGDYEKVSVTGGRRNYVSFLIPELDDRYFEKTLLKVGQGGDLLLDVRKANGGLDLATEMFMTGAIFDPSYRHPAQPAKSFDFIVFLGRTEPAKFLDCYPSLNP